MGRLFKSYYTDMLSDKARDEIKQHVRVTTIDSSSPRHIRKKPRRRESQSRASNSDGTDSEQDIRSQSQSRESASDNDLTDPDIDMIQDHHGTESTSMSSRTAIDESDSSNVDGNVQSEEMNEDDEETEQEDHDEPMTETDQQHGTESDESDLVILSRLKAEPESTTTMSDQTKRTTQTRLLELREKGNETIWVCRNCGTHVAHKDDIIAENFYGRSGGACLFVSAMNVTQGLVGHRHLASGEHDCADVYCAFCGAMLGWTYHGARDKHHRYKIGTYCLENKLIDTETHFLDVAKSEVVDDREMDEDGFEDMVDTFERKVFHKESSVNSLHGISRLRATREFDADD